MKNEIMKYARRDLIWVMVAMVLVTRGGMLVLEPPRIQAAEPQVFGLNTGTDAPYTTPERTGFLDLVVTEMFSRMGLQGRVNRYVGASARALQMSNSGEDDGEALRIGGLEKKFTNLMPIPESIISNDFVAYSRKGMVPIRDWNGLKPHSVTYLLGWQIFKSNVKDAKNVTEVRGVDQLFSLLKLGRVDVSLYEKWQGLYQVRQLKMEVMVHDPPLASIPMFMYLHKKHQALVPKAAQALAEMKRDGTYQKIFDKTLKPLL